MNLSRFAFASYRIRLSQPGPTIPGLTKISCSGTLIGQFIKTYDNHKILHTTSYQNQR